MSELSKLSKFLLLYAQKGLLKPLRKSCYRKFCRRNRGLSFTVTTEYGATMKVVIGDSVDNQIFVYKHFECGTSKVMAKLALHSDCLVDIGCNIGYYSCLFGKLNNKAHVYSIDPNPYVIERTKENVQLNGMRNCTTFNCGVGSENALLRFYFPQRRHSLGSFIKPNSDKDRGKINVFDVPVRPLKDILHLNDIDNAILKSDAEGFEWKILSGISPSDMQRFSHVIFEFKTELLNTSDHPETAKNIFSIPWFKDYQKYKIMPNGSLEPFSYVDGKKYSLNICLARKGLPDILNA